MPDPRALEQLIADGLLTRERSGIRTTRKWQGAMARAALALLEADDTRDDLRVPIVAALLEIYGDDRGFEDLVPLVEAMLPLEAQELNPEAPDVATDCSSAMRSIS